jgi:hypothetical protein
MKRLARLPFFYSFFLVFALIIQGIKTFPFDSSSDYLLVFFLAPPFSYFLFEIGEKLPRIKHLFSRISSSQIKIRLRQISLLSVSFLFLTCLFSAAIPLDYFFVGLLFPLAGYFWGITISSKFKKLKPVEISLSYSVEKKKPKEKFSEENDGVKNIQLRRFLKFLGGAGLGFFLHSLFNPRQAGAAFFGSVPGPGTVSLKNTSDTQIDPATSGGQTDVLTELQKKENNFGANNVEEASATVTYVGKEMTDGTWVVQKIDTSSGTAITWATETNNSGTTSYSTAWTNRASLTYGLYNQAF